MFRHREVGFLRQLTQRGQERLREKEVCPNHAHIIHTKYIRHLRRRPLPPRHECRGFSGVLMKKARIVRALCFLCIGYSINSCFAFLAVTSVAIKQTHLSALRCRYVLRLPKSQRAAQRQLALVAALPGTHSALVHARVAACHRWGQWLRQSVGIVRRSLSCCHPVDSHDLILPFYWRVFSPLPYC